MWINPKFRDRYPQPEPPSDSGRRLATLPRQGGAELRVTLAEYEGKPYVSLRVWEPGQDGQLWPVWGNGCSIRVGEVAEMMAALRQVEDLIADRPQSRQDARSARLIVADRGGVCHSEP